MRSRLGSVLALLALALAWPVLATAQAPSAADLATALGFDQGQIDRARRGEIVSRSIQESGRNEIGGAVAMLVKAPVAKLRLQILGEGFEKLDPSRSAQGRIAIPATAASFAALAIPPAELQRLARAQPGDDLNLSAEEIAALGAVSAQGNDAVAAKYKELLAVRVEAYRKSGLAGIAPYARSGGRSTSAGDALRAALAADAPLLKLAPQLSSALTSFPRVPAGFDERYEWAVIDVQGRPAIVLSHRLATTAGDAEGVATRQFYASQGFNAIQILVGLAPVSEGTAVFYVNRTSSDQAARFGRTAQAIGRRMLVGEVTRFFEAARKEVGG
jgi:hypothetical protein